MRSTMPLVVWSDVHTWGCLLQTRPGYQWKSKTDDCRRCTYHWSIDPTRLKYPHSAAKSPKVVPTVHTTTDPSAVGSNRLFSLAFHEGRRITAIGWGPIDSFAKDYFQVSEEESSENKLLLTCPTLQLGLGFWMSTEILHQRRFSRARFARNVEDTVSRRKPFFECNPQFRVWRGLLFGIFENPLKSLLFCVWYLLISIVHHFQSQWVENVPLIRSFLQALKRLLKRTPPLLQFVQRFCSLSAAVMWVFKNQTQNAKHTRVWDVFENGVDFYNFLGYVAID